jgi:methyl-accepting chemotaxis protein
LPFEYAVFDHILVGPDILKAVDLTKCFAELGRVLAEGGAVDIALQGYDGNSESMPAIDDILLETATAFRIHTIIAEQDGIVIKAFRRGTWDPRWREDLSTIANAFTKRSRQSREMITSYLRNIEELENRHNLVVQELTRVRKDLQEKAKDVAAARAALKATTRVLDVFRAQSTAQSRVLSDETAYDTSSGGSRLLRTARQTESAIRSVDYVDPGVCRKFCTGRPKSQ